ncbi:uncharacterized protein DUF421 [Pontibacter ummariensis]|uniref:YetF C-terminal domain-containing protein n=1 Tax=Pontibacter ummariensis TaxID=1610492 RepID=A0A239BFV3_9BACT|nr:YetF domain-containing protein [Pontibacter ummariensis]PRY16537.1 uncharacterized protein DUF421 [Pontibacter ummariensis]SNS06935.1 Protein of unknown function [Pontibacter ummariensis]
MDKIVFLWNGYEPLLRIVAVGTLTYIGIIILLRASGKRTLLSMNAFDFIITVAMGSAYGRILTAKQVSLAEALVTFCLLVSLQYIVSWLETRSQKFARVVAGQPSLLYYQGQFLEREMKKKRVRKAEMLAAARSKKLENLEQIEAIILETNGSLSVIKKSNKKGDSTWKQSLG